MLHHYMTKYIQLNSGKRIAESWIQLDLFGWCWCFSRKKMEIG